MKIRIPSSINLNQLFSEIEQNFPELSKRYSGKYKEYQERVLLLFHFMQQILNENQRKLSFKKNSSKVDAKWAQINRLTLYKIFASSNKSIYQYNHFIDFLETKYIRKRKYNGNLDYYVSGYCCKQFQFQTATTKRDYEITSKNVFALWNKIRLPKIEDSLLNSNELNYREIAAQNTDQLLLNHCPKVISILQNRYKPKSKIYSSADYLNDFNNNDLPFSIDKFGLRLHHKVSNLNSTLIPHLSLNGEKLTSIDIANSQPYFSSILTTQVLERLFQEKNWRFLNYVKKIFSKYQNEDNFLNYKNICSQGQLYELLQENLKSKEEKPITRNEAKDLFFNLSYSDYTTMGKDRRAQLCKLEKLFPSVVGLFRDLKSIDFKCPQIKDTNFRGIKSTGTNQSINYKNNCLLFQRAESFFIYHFVAKRLMEKDIWFTTIHDSIVCCKKDEILAMNEFLYAFNDLGVEPPKLAFKE